MKYKLHIPFVNRPDFLHDAVESLRDIGNIHVWADGVADPKVVDATVHLLPPLSFTGVMNMIIQFSWDDDVMIFAHNDCLAERGAAKRFIAAVEETRAKPAKWGALFTCYDVLAAFNMDAVRQVGYFDPMFYQYTADVDYYHRLRTAGWPEVCMANHGITHRNDASNTVKADPLFNRVTQWRERTNFDKDYYREKWGGRPGHEKNSRPFAA